MLARPAGQAHTFVHGLQGLHVLMGVSVGPKDVPLPPRELAWRVVVVVLSHDETLLLSTASNSFQSYSLASHAAQGVGQIATLPETSSLSATCSRGRILQRTHSSTRDSNEAANACASAIMLRVGHAGDFRAQVAEEIEFQARRVGHHASLAIWGGNNELEPAFFWFDESKQNPRLYAVDYAELFVNTVHKALLKVDPEVNWIDSSPTNGIISADPYVKKWGDSGSAHAGGPPPRPSPPFFCSLPASTQVSTRPSKPGW